MLAVDRATFLQKLQTQPELFEFLTERTLMRNDRVRNFIRNVKEVPKKLKFEKDLDKLE